MMHDDDDDDDDASEGFSHHISFSDKKMNGFKPNLAERIITQKGNP